MDEIKTSIIKAIIKDNYNRIFFLGYYCGVLVLMVIYIGLHLIKAIIERG